MVSIPQCWMRTSKVTRRAQLRDAETVKWDGAVQAPRLGHL